MSMSIEVADVILPGSEWLTVDYRQDSLPPLNVALYESFLAKRRTGRDALAIYLHLGYTWRRQHDNPIWATNQYLQNALGIGEWRVKVAKSLLARMQLIRALRQKDGRGRVTKTLTLLSLLPNPGPSTHADSALVEGMEKSPPMQKSTRVDDRTCGPGPEMREEEMKKRVEQPSAAKIPPTAEGPAEPSPSPAKRRGPKTPHGRVRALYGEFYRKNTRAASAPFNPACARQLKNDLARLGEDRLARCLRWLFEHQPARMGSFAYMSLHTFLPEAEKAIAGEDRRLSMIRVCPACGRQQEHTGADCLYCQAPLAGVRHAG